MRPLDKQSVCARRSQKRVVGFHTPTSSKSKKKAVQFEGDVDVASVEFCGVLDTTLLLYSYGACQRRSRRVHVSELGPVVGRG